MKLKNYKHLIQAFLLVKATLLLMEHNFQPIHKTITTFSGLTNIISEWESEGLSNEKFWPPYTANKILSLKLQWSKYRLRSRFGRNCIKQEDTVPVTPNSIVNLFIVYELDGTRDLDIYLTLKNCLFGAVKLTKNADPDKYKYSSYSIGFDSRGEFSLPDNSLGKMLLLLGSIWAYLCILIIKKKIT